jgi:hypothetical protein
VTLRRADEPGRNPHVSPALCHAQPRVIAMSKAQTTCHALMFGIHYRGIAARAQAGIQWAGAGVPWYEAGEFSYFAPTGSIFVTQLLMMGWAETRRWLDIKVRPLHLTTCTLADPPVTRSASVGHADRAVPPRTFHAAGVRQTGPPTKHSTPDWTRGWAPRRTPAR